MAETGDEGALTKFPHNRPLQEGGPCLPGRLLPPGLTLAPAGEWVQAELCVSTRHGLHP